MREIVHIQAGQCGNQIGAKVIKIISILLICEKTVLWTKSIVFFLYQNIPWENVINAGMILSSFTLKVHKISV